MDVERYTLELSDLNEMPENERTCFLMAGHLANEILFLSKLLVITQVRPEGETAQKAELTQSLFVIRMISGKLFEGWHSIRRSYHGTQVSRNYNDDLGDQAQSSLRFLGQYFANRDNLIASVRNNYAFHYSPDRLINVIDELIEGNENVMYIGDTHLSSLYYISDVLIARSMANDFNLGDIAGSLVALHDQIIEVQGHLLIFIRQFMAVAASRYFVRDRSNPVTVYVGPSVNLSEMRLPFFVEWQRQ